MPTYKKSTPETKEMCAALIAEFHPESEAAGLRVDILMAMPDLDEASGEPVNDAIMHNGIRALGLCKKVSLKDRTKGMGDAEILLDGYHWNSIDEPEQRALLDHELHHIVVTSKRDNLGRPLIKLRKHDVQVGWFSVIAKRHGMASVERQQAASIVEIHGQFYFPELIQANGTRAGKLELQEVR